MNADEPNVPEEDQLADLLASWDEALASGSRVEALATPDVPTPMQPELKRDLAYLELVRQALGPRMQEEEEEKAAQPEATGPTSLVPRSQTVSRSQTPVWERVQLAAEGAAASWYETPTKLGRFHVRRELGRGGFGVVFLAYDPQLHREVALKVPRPDVLLTPDLRERFHREARAASALDHPYVVPVHEAGSAGPVCFIVSAYCPGPTLADCLKGLGEPVPFTAAASFVAKLAEAVHYAHQHGIMHRDLKPANILLQIADCGSQIDQRADPQSTVCDLQSAIPKITDFGLAKLLDDVPVFSTGGLQTRTGAVLGTPSYMAPEQASGKKQEIGPAVDIYALGTILYELLVRRPPFQGETDLETLLQVRFEEPVSVARLRPTVPRDFETICHRCLQKDPHKRYASAGALAEDLHRFLGGRPILARPVSGLERLGRWCRRNPALAAASGLAAAALLAVVVVSILFATQQYSAAGRLRAALRGTQELSAKFALDRGISWCERGEIGPGLLWLVRSMEIAPEDTEDLRHVTRSNLSNWYGHLRPRLRTILPQENILALSLASDGQTILTVGVDRVIRKRHALTGEPVGELLLPHPVRSAAFSAGGEMLLTGDGEGIVRLWDIEKAEQRLELRGHRRDAFVAFSPNGRVFLSADADNAVHVWDAATGQPIGKPLQPTGGLSSVAVSPDGKLVVTGGNDKNARLWEMATGKELHCLGDHSGPVRVVAFHPDGKTIVTSGQEEVVRRWDVATGKARDIHVLHQAVINALLFSTNGQRMVTASSDKTVRLWDALTVQALGEPCRYPGGMGQDAISHNGDTLIARDDSSLYVWEVGPAIQSLHHDAAVQRVAFSPDGDYVLTGSFDKTARLWKAKTGGLHREFLGHSGRVHVVTFSPDGQIVLTASGDGTARLWDVASAKPIGAPLRHDASELPAEAVAFSPDGQYVLIGGEDGMARLWQVPTGREIHAFPGNQNPVSSVAFSKDGKMAITAAGSIVRFWDNATGEPMGTLARSNVGVICMALDPDGTLLLTGHADGVACLWDVSTRKLLRELASHQRDVRSVAFSPDCTRIVTASFDATARLWETATGKPLGEALHHGARIRQVLFSPDGSRVLTASFDGTARLWDVATRKPIGPPLRHAPDKWVVGAAFSPDGTSVATASSDGTAKIWPIPPPMPPGIDRLRLWVQLSTDLELDSEDIVRPLEPETWLERRDQLKRLGGVDLP
jgi:WD40 repeat protein